MSTYYVDPAATGSDNGTSWANAWTTLQKAVDGTGGTQPVAGDVVLCRGSETISAQIDFDGNSGDTTSGVIRYVGVNSSGTNDGTRYVIDANSAGIVGVNMNSNRISIENIEIKNATIGVNYGTYTGKSNGHFVNIYVHDCTGSGFQAGSNTGYQNRYVKCFSESNSYGFNMGGTFIGCIAKNCTNYGFVNDFYNQFYAQYFQCAAISCGTGFRAKRDDLKYFGCIAHGNTSYGFESTYSNGNAIYSGCRATSNGTGFSLKGIELLAGCYMPDTGQDLANTTKLSGIYSDTIVAGASTNNFAGTDTDGGYVDSSTGDFNLAETASLRRLEINIDGTNKFYMSAGLIPDDKSASGGGNVIVIED